MRWDEKAQAFQGNPQKDGCQGPMVRRNGECSGNVERRRRARHKEQVSENLGGEIREAGVSSNSSEYNND